MIDVRIVCAYDAEKTAHDIARRLEAEQHQVHICCGPFAPKPSEATRERDEAVLLIWSMDSTHAHYMMQWALSTAPERIVDIVRTAQFPALRRPRGAVVDFSAWNGERGGPAWRALTERLYVIEHGETPQAQMQRKVAMGAAAAAGVAIAGVVGVNMLRDGTAPAQAVTSPEEIAAATLEGPRVGGVAMGGPLEAPEFLDDAATFGPLAPRAALIAPIGTDPLLEAQEPAPSVDFAGPSLVGRLVGLADPILRDHRDSDVQEARNAP